MSSAEEINDSVALNGVKETKSVFLIDFTDVKNTFWSFYSKGIFTLNVAPWLLFSTVKIPLQCSLIIILLI